MRQPELPGENNVLSKLQISAIRAREVRRDVLAPALYRHPH